ncbi:MAG: hypothetical protein HZC01_04610 [Candidatus Kerfeldbacteria bacterium]|nr:hypothetical protein [Candidatus Kerfeldbacteria bacterium]
MRNSRDSRPDRGRGGRFGGRDGGRRSFDDRRGGGRFGGRDSGPKQMFEATCADCGDLCQVPFKPRGDRPVYCSNCFDKHNTRDERGGGDRRDSRPRFEEKRMFDATCDNCGNPCQVPFRPSGEKPVYCNDCFSTMGGGRSDRGGDRRDSRPRQSAGGDNKELLAQFNLLNAKLDRIISSLSPVMAKEVATKAKVVPAPVTPKVIKEKAVKVVKESKPAKAAKKKKEVK